MDYLKMILTGYLENQEYLTEYIIREQKKAEKEFINADEFFGRSKKVIQSLHEGIDKRLGNQKHDLYIHRDLAKSKSLKYRESKENAHLTYDEKCQQTIEYCESELKELSRNNFSIHISKDYFIGNLWNRQIKEIENHLKLAKKRLDKPDEQPQPEPKTKKGNLHTHIFKDNAFEVWQSMFESFEIKKSSLTDVRFMYEVMKKDDLIFNTIGEKSLRDWINETYSLTINKTKYTDPKWPANDKRRVIYSAAKDSVKQ